MKTLWLVSQVILDAVMIVVWLVIGFKLLSGEVPDKGWIGIAIISAVILWIQWFLDDIVKYQENRLDRWL